MGLKFSNFGKATIASAPSGTAGRNFTVEPGKGLLFPSLGTGDYFYGIFKDASGNREIVKIEARSTDSLTIAVGGRGLDGTTARNWAAGDYFVAGLTNVALQESLANLNLIALGQLPSSADKLPYFTGAGAAALATLTPFIRNLLDDQDAVAARATLGAASAASVTALIPSGTKMVFYQAAAPVGWTQDTNVVDYALRTVGGAGGGFGGSVPFTAAFTSQAVNGTVGQTTLTKAQIPPHTHGVGRGGVGSISQGIQPDASDSIQSTSGTAGGLGGGSHGHSFTGTAINLAVRYINVIVAAKN